MKQLQCHTVKVKDRQGKRRLHWTRPMLGSLTITQSGNQMIIRRQGIWGTKIYCPSISESVETIS